MTQIKTMRPLIAATAALVVALAAALVPQDARAQGAADPVVEAARNAGTVGEQADGYLGIRSGGAGDIKARVDAINIKRRAIYTDLAAKRGVTVADVGAATACELFQGRVAPGEWYRGEDGAWRQRQGTAAVVMPSYCG